MSSKSMSSKRLTNIDLLKIISIFAVIVIHISSFDLYGYNQTNIPQNTFYIYNIFNMISRFSVPCFIMISGMFLLDKDITIKQIFKKYILKIFLAYIIFGTIYAIFDFLNYNYNFLTRLLSGSSHLWYLLMLIGLYLVTPFLREIIKNKKLTQYFILLNFIFTILIPFVTYFIKIPGFSFGLKHMNINLPLGYTGYYVLGYYLSKHDVNKTVVYCLGIIGLLVNIILFNQIEYSNKLYDIIFLLPTTYFQSILVFLIFKDLKLKKNYFIEFIASNTLPIYIVHMIILKLLLNINLNLLYNIPFITIPFVSLFVFLISLLISIILKSIPLLKRIL